MNAQTTAAQLIEELISDAERELRTVGFRFARELETVQGLTAQMADAADYGYGVRASALTDAAQKVAQLHQQSKSLQDHIAALKQTAIAAAAAAAE